MMVCLTSCGSKQVSTGENKQNQELVNSKIAQKDFKIDATWAYPLASNTLNQLGANNGLGVGNNGSRINLQGNSDYLKIENDSAYGDLSYFGERRFSGGYNTPNGILFRNRLEDYSATFNEKKQRHEISFRVSHQTESFDINLDVYSSGNSHITVSSAYRTTIKYDGNIAIEE